MKFLFVFTAPEKKNNKMALAHVAQVTERQPVNQNVTSLIPSQGTCLGWGPGSPVGGMREATTHRCFSPLSPSFSPSLKINN